MCCSSWQPAPRHCRCGGGYHETMSVSREHARGEAMQQLAASAKALQVWGVLGAAGVWDLCQLCQCHCLATALPLPLPLPSTYLTVPASSYLPLSKPCGPSNQHTVTTPPLPHIVAAFLSSCVDPDTCSASVSPRLSKPPRRT